LRRLALLLVLLAGILLAGVFVLLAGLALLALLLAGLLAGLGLILPLLLLARLFLLALLTRLVALAALVIRHTRSPPGWFSQPKSLNPGQGSTFRENCLVPRVSWFARKPGTPVFAAAKQVEFFRNLKAAELAPRIMPNKDRIAKKNSGGGKTMFEARLLSRRRLLASVAAVPILAASADGASLSGTVPWSPFAGEPPKPVNPLGWYYFTPGEAATVEAIVDRLIPADHLSPGGKDCGCAVFIDRQLAGAFGQASRLYTKPPFNKGLPTQGYQGDLTPAGRYRLGLRALNDHTNTAYKKNFLALTTAQQDAVLTGLDGGTIQLKLRPGFSTKEFFELVLQNTMEGFFADPLYGGNRGMASWKMIGFPGARYDYRDHIGKHNQPYPKGPVSIYGEA
jgi:gluconate 2-dehydrogenase gamma chain